MNEQLFGRGPKSPGFMDALILAQGNFPNSYADLQATPEVVIRLIPLVRKALKHFAETHPDSDEA